MGVDPDLKVLRGDIEAARDEYSIGLLGWGTANRSAYSNPQVDQLLGEALSTLDRATREQLYRRATRLAIEDIAIIPLHHQVNIWATRKGFTYNARNDERTMVMELRPSK